MDESLLCQIGLSENLAHIYRLLVERKSLKPAQLAKITNETRANCYALLDKLVEQGLAHREDVDKKLTYFPESPVVLEKILSEKVVAAQAKLQAAQRALPRMLSAYNYQPTKTKVTMHHGHKQLEQMYTNQMEQTDQPIS